MKRKDNETKSERTKKEVYMDPACKFAAPSNPHTHKTHRSLHPTTWAGHLQAGMMLEASTNKGLKMVS